jgi:MerR family transcriptional regulator, light-induced transcriptional regulator
MEVFLLINKSVDELAVEIVDRQFKSQKEFNKFYGESEFNKYIEDTEYSLSYLFEAIEASSPELFEDYISWERIFLVNLGIPEERLKERLEVMEDVIIKNLPPERSSVAVKYIEDGIDNLTGPEKYKSFINEDQPLVKLLEQYLEFLLKGDRHSAGKMIMEAVDNGISVKDIYLHVFQSSLYEIGRLWQENKITVAQEHYFTAATQLIMSQLYPYISKNEKTGRVLVATSVSKELHEIGVRMVADFFEMDGWSTFYLGANTPTESIIETIISNKADLLLISATISSHIGEVMELIRNVRSCRECRNPKIIVGGYPFIVDKELWKKVGADGQAENAENAVEMAESLVLEGLGSF